MNREQIQDWRRRRRREMRQEVREQRGRRNTTLNEAETFFPYLCGDSDRVRQNIEISTLNWAQAALGEDAVACERVMPVVRANQERRRATRRSASGYLHEAW